MWDEITSQYKKVFQESAMTLPCCKRSLFINVNYIIVPLEVIVCDTTKALEL